MINKIVHFSDLHLKLFKEHENYRSILLDCFEQWRKISPDRIVFTGDLVHSKNQMTPELINMVSWVMSECASICKSIFLIGNHDFLENNQDRLDAITPIVDSIRNDNVVYYKDTGIYEDDNINWCVYSLVDDNKKPELKTNTNNKNIGLFHGPIVGLRTDVGFTFEEGFDVTLFDGMDLVLAGDIHKRQIFDIPGGKKAYMVGSLIQQNFGESIKNHGYGLYNVSENNYKFFDVDNERLYLQFKITDIEDIEDIENGKEKLINR